MKEIDAQWEEEFKGKTLILRTEMENEPYSAKMLRYNRLPGMPPLTVGFIDGQEEFRYDISGLKTLTTFVQEHSLHSEQIRNWMRTLLHLFSIGEGYLLKEADFVCRPEYLFLTPKEELQVCYLEGYREPVGEQLRTLLGLFLEHVDYQDEEAVALVYDLYQCCNEEARAADLKEILEREKRVKKPEISVKEVVVEPEAVSVLKEEVREKTPKKDVIFFVAMIVISGALMFLGGQIIGPDGEFHWLRTLAFVVVCAAAGFFTFRETLISWWKHRKEEETFDWGEEMTHANEVERPEAMQTTLLTSGETQLLTGMLPKMPFAVLEMEDGSSVAIEKVPFSVGALEKNDLCLPVRTVSRSHAQFVMDDQVLFLRDLGSTNGTWLNGKRLSEEKQTELREGDAIEFAKERVIFHTVKQHDGLLEP
ncbi:MAG: FHA domain-containing protein [Lachnospiraceae bacterium]|nr:FHA domain-containing protein [Lachnospiraceae bacterium]